jgi:hypothetical protein
MLAGEGWAGPVRVERVVGMAVKPAVVVEDDRVVNDNYSSGSATIRTHRGTGLVFTLFLLLSLFLTLWAGPFGGA